MLGDSSFKEPQGEQGQGLPLPPGEGSHPRPLDLLFVPLPSPWTRFCPGRTQRTQVLSLTRSPLGPRNPSGPLSPLSPCSDKGGQERVNNVGGQVTLPRVAEARGTATRPHLHLTSCLEAGCRSPTRAGLTLGNTPTPSVSGHSSQACAQV